MSVAKTIEMVDEPTSGEVWLPGDSAAGQAMAQRHELGQFLTPDPVADFMASLFHFHSRTIQLLDAGAGDGALTSAIVRRLCREPRQFSQIFVTAYEIDPGLIQRLHAALSICHRDCERAGLGFSATVHNTDFIAAAVPMVRKGLFAPELPRFNATILNPPYRKIRSDSATRLLLRSAGIEASNLYTGFLALGVRFLSPEAEMVAITPRSFCNGPYFRHFRADFLAAMSLRHLHIFKSRSAAFNGDDVLQENIILHAVKSTRKPERVVISNSSGEPGAPVGEHLVPYQDVVSPADPDQFIHLVTDDRQARAKSEMQRLSATLADLGLSVSTGRVVDFRAESSLRQQPSANTAPLIYPCHFSGGFVRWPKPNARKPNAIVADAETHSLLIPSAVYVLVKRFTSKEERRRVVACVYDPHRVPAATVAFENHLNYFHATGHGLPMTLAKGLALFLNSTLVDTYFRQFSGHTQVNATDLRSLRYPTRQQLDHLGRSVDDPAENQQKLDYLLEKELNVTI